MATSSLEKRQQFIQYITILSQKLNIDVVFGDDPAVGPHIRLPKLDNISEDDIDFLYTHALREMGFATRSNRNISDLLEDTKLTLEFAYWIEGARIENALQRKFAGANERFKEYWNTFAQDERYMPMTLKKPPQEWTPHETMMFYAFWELRNKPSYSYLNDIPHWDKVTEFFNQTNIQEVLHNTPMRSWKDTLSMTRSLLPEWITFSGIADDSMKIMDTPGAEQLRAIVDYQRKLDEQRNIVAQMKADMQAQMDDINKREREKFTDEEWAERQQAEQQIKDFEQMMKEHPELKEAWDELRNAQREVEHLQEQLMSREAREAMSQAEVQNKIASKQQELQNKEAEMQEKFSDMDEKSNSRIQRKQEKISQAQQDINNELERLRQIQEELNNLNYEREQLENMLKPKTPSTEQSGQEGQQSGQEGQQSGQEGQQSGQEGQQSGQEGAANENGQGQNGQGQNGQGQNGQGQNGQGQNGEMTQQGDANNTGSSAAQGSGQGADSQSAGQPSAQGTSQDPNGQGVNSSDAPTMSPEQIEQHIQNVLNSMQNIQNQGAPNPEMASSYTPPKSISAAERKMSSVNNKIESRQERLERMKQSIANDIEKMRKRAQDIMDEMNNIQARKEQMKNALEAKKSAVENNVAHSKLGEKLYNAQSAKTQTEQQLKHMQRQQAQSMERLLARAARSGVKSEQLSEAAEKFKQGHQFLNQHDIQSKIQASAYERREQRDIFKSGTHDIAKEAFNNAAQFQEKMDKQGIDVNLVPRFEEISGWDQANDLQRQFDQQATEQSGESVINGRGGGKGSRNAEVLISKFMNGVNEIDPHVLFKDVIGTDSSGHFSHNETGDLEQHEAQGLHSKIKHSVWRKEYDGIHNVNQGDAHHLRQKRKEYSALSKKVTEALKQYLKPSFKNKFRSGREEGDLDARSIWKLAANKGEDFYEDTVKRPTNKMAASILVDVSGSLASWGKDAEEYIQAMVMMLSDALSECHIEHEIITHSAPLQPELIDKQPSDLPFNRKSCSLQLHVIKNFKAKEVVNLKHIKMTSHENADNEAVREAYKRLKKHGAKEKMMFLIGDGKPFMFDADPAILDSDLRDAVAEMAKNKVRLISLGQSVDHAVLPNHIYVPFIDNLAEAIQKAFTATINEPTLHL